MKITKIPFDEEMKQTVEFPNNWLPMDKEGIETWNEIVTETAGYKTLNINPKGFISKAFKDQCYRAGSRDVNLSSSRYEVAIIDENLDCYRITFGNQPNTGKTGRSSFTSFNKLCKKFGVDLMTYKINDKEEAYRIKMEIPHPMIWCNEAFVSRDEDEMVIENCHHIDIHSAHMAGVAKAFPDLYPVINEIYTRRKDPKVSESYKAILTHTWGFMQSKYTPVNYGFSHLSKAGIEFTNINVSRLCDRLSTLGYSLLLINTDGIWYTGDTYHGEGEGTGLGEWSNDWQNCTLRFRSKGCYEFIGQKNGEGDPVYKAVVRGLTKLDWTKPDRDTWEWGDIYKFNYIEKHYINKETLIITEGKDYA